MKKALLILLVLLGLSLSSFALFQKDNSGDENIPAVETQLDPKLEKYLSQTNSFFTPVREYGETDSYVWMDKDFVTRFLYPVGQSQEMNEAITKWINSTSSYYHAQSVDSSRLGNRTELTVDYCSYIINDSIASVKLQGKFFHPALDNVLDVGESFNADISTGKLLKLEDLLLPEGLEKLTVLLVDKSGIYGEQVDENILKHWFLRPDGLEITFYPGEYRPASLGMESFLFSYDILEDILVLPETSAETESPPIEPELLSPTEPSAMPGIDPKKPMIALTFDDGPGEHTDKLLDILAKNNSKATFFLVGNMIEGREETLLRMADAGHELGGHSWDHRQLTSLDSESIAAQVMQTRAKIYEITGIDSKIVRPPYGSYNDKLRSISAQLGVSLVNWSVDSQDWMSKDKNALYNSIINNVRAGSIVLCSDLKESTVDAMERVIPALIEKGYQFVTVSELFTHNGGALSAGTVYFNR